MLKNLKEYAQSVASRHGVPALSIAVWDGDLHTAACGMANVAAGIPAATQTAFQIGSISKVFTATLAMQAAEEGKVGLDQPVAAYLPDLDVGERATSETVTLRQLLCHTSGLGSDVFVDAGRAEDVESIKGYVARCAQLPQIHGEPGKVFSYSNAAYVIAGRVLEVVLDMAWADAIERRILVPLQMEHSFVRPKDSLRMRAAMGHIIGMREGVQTVAAANTCYMAQGLAPAGAVLTASASDLVKFARAHLMGVSAAWISAASANEMRKVQVRLPAPTMLSESAWGIGWALTEQPGAEAFGHGGGTIGQQSLLEVYPDHGLILALQVNGMSFAGAPALQEVLGDMRATLVGASVAADASPVSPCRTSAERFAGVYGVGAWRIEVQAREGVLGGRITIRAGDEPLSQAFRLQRISENVFAAYAQGGGERLDNLTFTDGGRDGKQSYLFTGYRLHPKSVT